METVNRHSWLKSSCCSVAKSYQNLCNPMDCSTPGFPSFTVSWSLPRLMSVESEMLSNYLILWHPLLLPSIFLMSWLFTSSGQSIWAWVSVSVLPMNIQSWCPVVLTGLISLQPMRLSRVFSKITVWKHQFFSAWPSLWSIPHIHTWLLEKP